MHVRSNLKYEGIANVSLIGIPILIKMLPHVLHCVLNATGRYFLLGRFYRFFYIIVKQIFFVRDIQIGFLFRF